MVDIFVTLENASPEISVSVESSGPPGKSPYIGENGTWMVWQDGAWVDTGVVAKGGDAVIPNIGENGNWFVDSKDTGVKAQGPQGIQGVKGNPGEKGDPGSDGYTPQRGVDYWTDADKQEILAEIIDDAQASPTHSWSGKKVATELEGYAPIESAIKVSGTGTRMVSLSPTVAWGLQGLTLCGRTTQDGTPSPENPVPLVSVGDNGSVELVVTGANILPLPDKSGTQYGVNFEIKNGVVKIDGINSDGPVSIWGGFVNTSILFYLVPGKYSLTNSFSVRSYNGIIRNTYNRTFELTQVTGITDVAIATNKSVDGYMYPMLNFGGSVLPWEPYQSQSLTLSTPNGLPGIPVTNGGNFTDENGQQWICDEVDFEKGVKRSRVSSVMISECTSIANARQKNPDYYGCESSAITDQAVGYQYSALCDKSVFAGVNAALQGPQFTIVSSNGYLVFGIPKTVGETLEEVNSYLASNPLTILVVTPNVEETPLTAEELDAYRALTSYPNTTNITALDCGIQATAIADGTKYLEQIAQRIAALESAATNI